MISLKCITKVSNSFNIWNGFDLLVFINSHIFHPLVVTQRVKYSQLRPYKEKEKKAISNWITAVFPRNHFAYLLVLAAIVLMYGVFSISCKIEICGRSKQLQKS